MHEVTYLQDLARRAGMLVQHQTGDYFTVSGDSKEFEIAVNLAVQDFVVRNKAPQQERTCESCKHYCAENCFHGGSCIDLDKWESK